MANFPTFLRIVANSETEIVEINGKKEKRIIFDRTGIKITELLAHALKFSYTLIPAGDIDIGKKLSNGTWTGKIGLVQQNEADMIIGRVAVSEQRLEVVDFSYPYYRVRITFATKKPEYVADFHAFLLPFSLDAWLFAIASAFLIPAACYVLFENKHRFSKLLFAALKAFVYQDMGIQPTDLKEYFLLAFWQIGIAFLTFCYTCVLLSFLTFPTLSGIGTIPELAAGVATGRYQCITYPGSFLNSVLLHSSDVNDRIIGRNLMKNRGSIEIEDVLNNKKSKKKPVFIGGEIDLLPYKLKYFISDDEFVPALRSIALQKNFCCKKQLDEVIAYVWASGIFEKLKEDAMFMKTLLLVKPSSDILKKHEQRSLSLEDLAGAFILLIFCYILATMVFIVEVIVGAPCRRKIVLLL